MARSSIKRFDAFLKVRQQKAAPESHTDSSARVMKVLTAGPQPLPDLQARTVA